VPDLPPWPPLRYNQRSSPNTDAVSWVGRFTAGNHADARRPTDKLMATRTLMRTPDPQREPDITELPRVCLIALRIPEQADRLRPLHSGRSRMRQLLGALPDGSPVSSMLVASLELARTGPSALDWA
jgi:hypothetical protein